MIIELDTERFAEDLRRQSDQFNMLYILRIEVKPPEILWQVFNPQHAILNFMDEICEASCYQFVDICISCIRFRMP